MCPLFCLGACACYEVRWQSLILLRVFLEPNIKDKQKRNRREAKDAKKRTSLKSCRNSQSVRKEKPGKVLNLTGCCNYWGNEACHTA